ncbi:sensor histidine kinase [Taibaiella koreensis]|uniref:sensor histidine kinase n=1 Tax=Taibaiella koreensis TaxID=1268548 RepID=UPI0013C344C0|nr:histidine kinase [Taibaiella koreensis]
MRPVFPGWFAHVIAIILFIGYEVTFIFFMGHNIDYSIYIPYYALAIIWFYANAYLVMPLWEKGYKLLTIVLVVLETLLYFLIITVIGEWQGGTKFNQLLAAILQDHVTLLKNIYRSIYLLGLSITYWLGRRMLAQRTTLLNQQLTIARLELDYYRAQANPHLIFNVLNNLREDIIATHPGAATTITNLAELMHYAYRQPEPDGKVNFDDEVRYLRTYLALQQSRKESELQLNVFIDVADGERLRILPLILITLVENVFKYGVTDDPSEIADIRITLAEKQLKIFTRNHKKAAGGFKSRYGIGLANLRLRLDQFYPLKHQLLIKEDAIHFEVALSIEL